MTVLTDEQVDEAYAIFARANDAFAYPVFPVVRGGLLESNIRNGGYAGIQGPEFIAALRTPAKTNESNYL